MPQLTAYHCQNCGYEFTIEILTRDEVQKARDKGERVGDAHCPKCFRVDLIKIRSAA